MKRAEVRLILAQSNYDYCYQEQDGVPREKAPSPGWSWTRTSQEMRDFCICQADYSLRQLEARGAIKLED